MLNPLIFPLLSLIIESTCSNGTNNEQRGKSILCEMREGLNSALRANDCMHLQLTRMIGWLS